GDRLDGAGPTRLDAHPGHARVLRPRARSRGVRPRHAARSLDPLHSGGHGWYTRPRGRRPRERVHRTIHHRRERRGLRGILRGRVLGVVGASARRLGIGDPDRARHRRERNGDRARPGPIPRGGRKSRPRYDQVGFGWVGDRSLDLYRHHRRPPGAGNCRTLGVRLQLDHALRHVLAGSGDRLQSAMTISRCVTRAHVALITLAAICWACGDDRVNAPLPVLPLYYLKAPTNSGDGQSDTVLATLALPFRVLVRRGDAPARDVTVLWEIPGDTLLGV